MQDKIDDLQLSSDDNDTRQMDELHEDSDASMKDSEALVSASMLASTAAGREERDVSIQSYDSEPKVDVMKRIEQLSNRYKEMHLSTVLYIYRLVKQGSQAKELVRTGDEILKKLRSRSPVAQPQEVAIPIPRTWDGLSFEDAVMKCDNFTNSSPKTSCVPIGKRLFSSPAGVSTEAFKKLVGSSSQLVQYTDHQREEKGCWLGNPSSHGDERQKVWIPLGDQGKVEMAETISKNAPRLAVNLLSVFFTREKLASGNCTPAPNRELLDQKVIHGIRLHLKHIHPMTTTKEEEDRASSNSISTNFKCLDYFTNFKCIHYITNFKCIHYITNFKWIHYITKFSSNCSRPCALH
eukprot:Em0006g376a